MKIAVVGAGIFGVTVAFKLAENHSVDLYEKNDDILKAASDVNQCRIHRGYHYPRSDDTARSVIQAESSFKKEFSDAVMNNTENYYCVSKEDSLTTSEEYIDFCKRNNLEFTPSRLHVVQDDMIDLCVKVKENLFDHSKLKQICWQKLNKNKVNVLLQKKATEDILKSYDYVVLCTYTDMNELLKNYSSIQQELQFEVCEKLFVKLPNSFKNKSIVIMDGPFMSVEPVGRTDYFIIGDVVNTVLQRSVGLIPQVDEKFSSLLNKRIIKKPPISNFKNFIDSAERFMPEIKKAEHIGSSFCIKTVLPNVDNTDARPTLIKKINENTLMIFSGKIPTCVDVAEVVLKKIENV